MLFRNGILIGYDYRIDREVHLFYLIKEHTIIPWQDHLCNRNCETECKTILESVRTDHDLEIQYDVADIRNLFKNTIEEIIKRSKEEKNNE